MVHLLKGVRFDSGPNFTIDDSGFSHAIKDSHRGTGSIFMKNTCWFLCYFPWISLDFCIHLLKTNYLTLPKHTCIYHVSRTNHTVYQRLPTQIIIFILYTWRNRRVNIQVLYICGGNCIRTILKEGVESPAVIVPPGPCGECPHTLTVVRIFPTRGRPDVGRIPPWGVD